ncbi:MAG TPA: ATP-binding protein [Stellaceae bacterium]|jgi:signal transduction histidine kinase|nr:ATP-binding protein [Stellaceae bacterium]
MAQLTIRTRLILLAGAALLVLIATNFYLTRTLRENSAGMVKAAGLLKGIEQADSARIRFGEMRYWMTDLAVSQLTLSERNAATARARMEEHLSKLAPWNPERIAAVRGEVAQYEESAAKAVDDYTNDRRVIGNSLLAQARQHSIVADRLLDSIVTDLTGEALVAREQAVAEAAAAIRLSQIVVSAAVLVGALLTFLLLRAIVVPLRRLESAMAGLNTGNVDVAIPAAGPDEIGAVARTLARFRDTLVEQNRRERDLRAAHEELKATQASLIHAEKMASLGQLTAGIAHEIKNPLNFVNNFASLSVELLDELKETVRPVIAALGTDKRAAVDEVVDMLTANLEKIAEHGRRADGIVKSMLAHSRGASGERQRADLNALTEEALNLAYHGARAQDPNFNITLDREFDRTIAPIELVPQDISRVLLNLFGNGFYAADKRRREGTDAEFRPVLKVVTRDLGNEVEIRVRDNGTGIPTEFHDKLFQPFFTTKPTGEGTGLGLSISYDIVTQQHGGTITVDSRLGEFTEFTIRLPRSRQTATAGTRA